MSNVLHGEPPCVAADRQLGVRYVSVGADANIALEEGRTIPGAR